VALSSPLSRRILALAVLTLFAGAAASGLRDQLRLPSEGWELDAAHRVIRLRPGGAAERAGLELGDRIIAVENVSVDNAAGLQRLAAGFQPGQEIRVRYEREEQPRVTTLQLDPPTRTTILAAMAQLVIGALFAASGLIVLGLKPTGDRLSHVFVLLCILYGLLKVIHLRPTTVGAIAAYRLAFQVVWTAIPFVFAHFSLLFPRTRSLAQNPRHLRVLYAPLGVLVGLTAFTQGHYLFTGETLPVLELINLVLALIAWFLCLLFGVGMLFSNLFQPMTPEEIRRYRPLLVAVIAAVIPYFVVFVIDMARGQPPGWTPLAELPTSAIPLVLAWLLLHNQRSHPPEIELPGPGRAATS
jgi:membrane-associated protease RseP (regulator of RpoE activity)